jgi:transcriptional regulator with XRE-family HTH domain
MQIGEKIRKIREMKGISQDYIAKKLRISPQAYGKIEREETRLDVQRLNAIAQCMDVDPIDIINFDETQVFNNTFNNHAPHNNNFTLNHAMAQNQIVFEKLIESQKEHIQYLHTEVAALRKTNELLLRYLNDKKSGDLDTHSN